MDVLEDTLPVTVEENQSQFFEFTKFLLCVGKHRALVRIGSNSLNAMGQEEVSVCLDLQPVIGFGTGTCMGPETADFRVLRLVLS